MANLISYEPPTPPLELRDEMDVAATASVGFYIMLALSATLATLGLIANSAAVIIGAMIIAPLMNPIIAFSFSCARGNWRILRKAAFSVATGIVVVLFVSILVTKIVGSRMEGAEVLSRSHPNLIDLGVAIASGIAGAIAWSRRKISNALPGVAIAVALVPPLCTVGIGLALGSSAVRDPLHPHLVEVQNIEFGAALLFLTNFVAILLFGGLVFLVQGYGRLRRAMIGLTISLVAIVVLGFPLASSFKEFLLRSRVMETLKQLTERFPDWEQAYLSRVKFGSLEDGTMTVALKVEATAGVITEEDVAAVEKALADEFGRKVIVDVYLSEFIKVRTGTAGTPGG